MRATNVLYLLVAECFIAGAESIGATDNGGLQNGVVVRIAYHGRRRRRDFHQNAGGFQKSKILLDGPMRQWPASLHVGIGKHTVHLDQDGRGEDQRMRSGYGCQKEIAGKALG